MRFDGGDGARQVHPVVVREFVTVLGRNDGARPLLMLAIVLGDEADRERRGPGPSAAVSR